MSVPLLPDEILSSWLVRTALVQGCDPMTLTGWLWPGWRAWTVDIDRSISDERLERLSRAAGIPVEKLRPATLAPAGARVVRSQSGRGTMPWIMVTGARNRKRRTGIQICPACLADDSRPYCRIQWRLAWHAACPTHLVVLLDRCPECGSPVQPHRLEAESVDMARCHACGFDFRRAPAAKAEEAALAFQREADMAVMRNRGAYGSMAGPACEWFALARFVIGIVRKAGALRLDVLDRMLARLGVDAGALPVPETGLALEMLPPRERAGLFAAVWKIMEAGPDGLADAAGSAGATLRTLTDKPRRMPSALLASVWQAVPSGIPRRKRNAVSSGFRPKSKRAVMRQWARLQRKWAAEES
ncbi:TniQ family protein [Alcanivorax sp.]|uniref:TniQ family protein n=1 Tax=Alcanivorax sp. TaxID=1872427 RepID=UPI00258674AC|nr:TniQ family protein [Alcanivorax sp.]